MAQYQAFDPNTEVRGDIVRAMINVMGAFKAIAVGILADQGIREPRPLEWYPLQAWLSSFETIASKVGPNTIYQIGRQIPDEGYYPPGVESVEDVLEKVGDEYRICHRGGDIGSYDFTFTGAKTGRMVCHNPYPCDFDRGLIESLVYRFEGEESLVHVEHEDRAPCRKSGADSCTFSISW